MDKMKSMTRKKRSIANLLPVFNAVVASAFCLMFMMSPALAKDVTLAWDANQEEDVAGYKVYYGTSSGAYTGSEAIEGHSPIDFGNVTSATFVGLDDTKSHYFTVTAYNFNGEESTYSNEVNSPTWSYSDYDGDGYDQTVDCDDYNAKINPGATEIHSNGIDENCNGMDDDVQIVTPSGGIEAESGSLTTPMQKVADSAAAGGYYIQTTTNGSGSAIYNFNIATPGVYKFVARSFMPSGSADSFYVNVDGLGEFTWYLTSGIYNTWSENEITNGAAGTYTAELTSGNHSITFKGREANAKLDYFYLVKVGESVISDADQDGYDMNSDCNDNNAAIHPGATEMPYNGIDENCNGMDDDVLVVAPVVIEAESGNLTTPMQTLQDSNASGGSYIETTKKNTGTATYTIQISTAGTYKIIARVFAANKFSDSYFVEIDNKGEVIWDLNPTGDPSEFNVWREDDVTNRGNGTFKDPQIDPYTVELSQGSHTLTFRGRESGTKLDNFTFVKM